MEKKKDNGPILKRDENNRLDQDDAARVTQELTRKLITESRDFQKEISFKHSRDNRRDVVVKVVLYQRNTVNGKIVKSDSGDPLFEKLSNDPLDGFRYKYFEHIDMEISVKEMPMPLGKAGKWILGGFSALSNYLARMWVFNDV